jgi:tRNA 2-(methylsulfanyl)-N6-isopentenyladenosine37 hydroxylase
VTDFLQPVRDFLACATPPEWVSAAVQDVPLLLQDHANCEKKAASTAMNMLFRYNDREELQTELAICA